MLEGLISVINNLDFSLFYFINVTMNNYILTLIMPVISELGVKEYWIIGCGALYLFSYYKGGERVRKAAVLCLIAVLIAFYTNEILKTIFQRPRPFMTHQGVNLVRHSNYIFPSGHSAKYSFPSGHSAVIFAACTIFSRKFGYWPLFMALACLVGFSRIYLGFHYPLDVVFGALLGIGISLLILKYENQIWGGFSGLIRRIKSFSL